MCNFWKHTLLVPPYMATLLFRHQSRCQKVDIVRQLTLPQYIHSWGSAMILRLEFVYVLFLHHYPYRILLWFWLQASTKSVTIRPFLQVHFSWTHHGIVPTAWREASARFSPSHLMSYRISSLMTSSHKKLTGRALQQLNQTTLMSLVRTPNRFLLDGERWVMTKHGAALYRVVGQRKGFVADRICASLQWVRVSYPVLKQCLSAEECSELDLFRMESAGAFALYCLHQPAECSKYVVPK